MADERNGNDGRSEVTAGLCGDIPGRRVALTNETEETSDRAMFVAFDLSDISTGANVSRATTSTSTKEQNVCGTLAGFGTD